MREETTREVQRMRAQLADDATVVARIFDHIDNHTTDLAQEVWREPTANYFDPDRLSAEISLMRRLPVPFCPSSALMEVGSYVALQAAGVPILAVRGTDGTVRAFRNACRHRGVQLAEGAGCKTTFVCPYHAWTYGLDGALRGIPDDYGFPGLNKAEHGLAPVKAREAGGLVWITQEGDGDDAAIDLVPELFPEDWRVIGQGHSEIEANWKVFAEGLIEGYHIKATHPETFYPRQYDNLNVIEGFGRNSRVTYPFQNIEKYRDVPAEARRIDAVSTQVYHLFPNAAVATFPTHRSLTIMEPLGPSRTRTTSFTLTNRPQTGEQKAQVDRRRDFVTEGAREDRAVQMAVQRGLAAGANTHFTFGLFEGALTRLHKNLAELIGA